jgi:hypothetical protein
MLGPNVLISDVRRLGCSGGATHPVAPAKPQRPDFGIELVHPEFAFLGQDGFDLRGNNKRSQREGTSDGIHSPQ